MQILKIDKKNNEISFILHTIEDLWAIKSIISPGDIISGGSYRRQRQEELGTSERKPVFVSILIEKFDYSSELNSLRFTGVIVFSKPPELAPLRDHHTLEIVFSEKYNLKKNNLFQYQIDILKKISSMSNKLSAIVIDDEKAEIFELTDIGIGPSVGIPSGKSGKRYESNYSYDSFFEKIYELIKGKREPIIIAGPGQPKTKLKEFLLIKDNTFKISLVNIQNISKSSIKELFTKKEISKVFENSLIYKENKYLEEFLKNLGKDTGKSIYGLKEVSEKINTGAIEFILITEDIWKNNVDKIQELIINAEKYNSKVHVVDSTHLVTETIDSFGGIIALLRYKV